MNMEIFAKTISTPMHQVLVTKGFGEDGTYVVEVKASFPGVYPSVIMGFETEKKRDRLFDEYDEAMAASFIEQVTNVFGG